VATGEESGTVIHLISLLRFLSRGASTGYGGLLVVLGLALPSLALTALPARTGTLEAAHIKEAVFPSGLRLIVKEARATDLAAVQVWIRAGGFLEDERTSGTAHVIEHLIFKGSETRGPGSIDDEIENLGGLLEAQTTRDWTNFSCTVSGRYVGKVLSIIADALRKPRLRPEDFEAEKPIILEEINQVQISPEAAISAVLHALAFRNHPYKHDPRGTELLINNLDLKDVRAYYEKYYVPSNMTVVVVGDVDAAGVERVVRASFQADTAGAKTAPFKLPPDERACSRPDRKVVTTDFANGYVGLAYPAPAARDDPDVYAMDVLLTLLEHENAGRLPRLLKNQGVVQATYETRRQPGLFTVISATEAGSAEQVEALMRKELDFAGSQPVPAAELAVAKRMLRGTYALDNEPYSGQAATLGFYASIDRWQFASEYLARIEAVTAEQVQDAARKYLASDRCVSVLLKPRMPMSNVKCQMSNEGSPHVTRRCTKASEICQGERQMGGRRLFGNYRGSGDLPWVSGREDG
jgi:zinc protease